MECRIEKKASVKGLFTFYNWNVDTHYKFAYDGYKTVTDGSRNGPGFLDQAGNCVADV